MAGRCASACVVDGGKERRSWAGEVYIYIEGGSARVKLGLGHKMNKKADEYTKRKNESLQKTNL